MDKAIKAIAKLPAERQDQLAEMLIGLTETTPYKLSSDEQQAIDEGRADVEAGRVASDAEVAATFARLRSV